MNPKAQAVIDFALPRSAETERRLRNVVINGRRTSVKLEQLFWDQLDAVAEQQGISTEELISRIDAARVERIQASEDAGNLHSTLRVWALSTLIRKT